MPAKTATQSADPFLPDDYEVPTKPSRFMKLKIGENTFRILAAPLRGWVVWVQAEKDKKMPVRHETNDFRPGEYDPKQPPKHFWAMPVWDYKDRMIKVLELTQSTIQQDIKNLTSNKKWGHPAAYDITVTAVGEGMEREYTTMPNPKDELAEDASAAWTGLQGTFDLRRLWMNDDPFGEQSGNGQPASRADDSDLPF